MAGNEASYVVGELRFKLEETSYKGEKWYQATGGLPGCLMLSQYGRTPERALAFLLESCASSLKSGKVCIAVLANNGVVSEIVDFTGAVDAD